MQHLQPELFFFYVMDRIKHLYIVANALV